MTFEQCLTRKKKELADVTNHHPVHTHRFTMTRKGRDVSVVMESPARVVTQKHVNAIAAHVRHVEATHTPPKPAFRYYK